jgi:hypothetical protein
VWVLHVKDRTWEAVSSLFSYVDHRKAGVAGRGGLSLAHTDSTTEECMDTEHAIRTAVNLWAQNNILWILSLHMA